MTTVAKRPDSISGCMQTWNEVKTPLTIRTTMDNPSTVKVRRRYTTSIFNIDATLTLQSYQYNDFTNWYEVDCLGGVYPTRIKRPQDGFEIVVRFTEPPVIEWIDKNIFKATMRFEQLPAWVSLTDPINTVLPVITGNVWAGSLLTCSSGDWTGITPITYDYEWYRGAVLIGTGETYTSVYEDAVGISCTVTATNQFGVTKATSALFYPDERAASFDLKTYPLDSRITYSRSMVATGYDQDGNLVDYAINEPRPYRAFGGGAILGLMVEESSTNSVPNNTMFGASGGSLPNGWIQNFNSITGITATIGDKYIHNGIECIDVTLAGTSVGVGNYALTFLPLGSAASAVQGDWISGSIFVQQLAGTALLSYIIFNEYSAVDASLTGHVIGSSFIPAALTRHGGSLQATDPACAKITSVLVVQIPDATVINTTFRIGLPQIEAKEISVTSPIRTSAVPVTRGADVASVPDANFSGWFNQSEGTFLSSYQLNSRVSANANSGSMIIGYSANITQGSIIVRDNTTIVGSDAVVYSGGSAAVDTAQFTSLEKIPHKAAVAYATDNFAFTLDGLTPLTDNTCPFPLASLPNRLYIMNSVVNGYIAEIEYWNVRLPNNKLVELSQP